MANRIVTAYDTAAAALAAYHRAHGVRPAKAAAAHLDDQEAAVSDLIADLLHYAHGRGFDTARIIRCAVSNSEAERANLAAGIAAGLSGAELSAAIDS